VSARAARADRGKGPDPVEPLRLKTSFTGCPRSSLRLPPDHPRPGGERSPESRLARRSARRISPIRPPHR
jgi:hypothetical protein